MEYILIAVARTVTATTAKL